MKSERIPGFFIGVVLVALGVCASAADPLPATVLLMVEESEENFFDGDLGNAARRLEGALEWINANKALLGRQQVDHSVIESFVAGLQAEIKHAAGHYAVARGRLNHAERTLKARIGAYTRRGMFPPVLWQFEAFLNFVRGDISRPLADYGLSKDAKLPEKAREFLASRQDSSHSVKAYRKAETILADPRANGTDGDSYRINRLYGRLFTSLGWVQLLKGGKPSANEIADAKVFLERAEQSFAKNDFWKQVVKDEGFEMTPKTYKEVDQIQLPPPQRLELKRKFAQLVQDWTSMQMLRIELTAFDEQAGEDAALADKTEDHYDRLVNFLKSQYSPDHPCLQRVLLSRARWYVVAARADKLPNETKKSLLKDCMHNLESIKTLAADDMLQKDVVELAAIRSFLDLNQAGGGLAAAEAARLGQREADLCGKLEALEQGAD